jgi:hypothetical protein
MQTDFTTPHETDQKTCSQCKSSKPISEFNFKQKALGKRQSYCKKCGSNLTRSHYRRNKRQYLDRNSRTNARHRALIRAAKSRPCVDCGVRYPYYVMDFDHREGTAKSFILSDVPRATSKSLMQEIDKCDLVCANCHRERTHQRALKGST